MSTDRNFKPLPNSWVPDWNTYRVAIFESDSDFLFKGDFNGLDPTINLKLGDVIQLHNCSKHNFYVEDSNSQVVFKSEGSKLDDSIKLLQLLKKGSYKYSCPHHKEFGGKIIVS